MCNDDNSESAELYGECCINPLFPSVAFPSTDPVETCVHSIML